MRKSSAVRERAAGLTQARLKELFDYDPETGVFIWKVWRSSTQAIGAVAGCKTPSGYISISIDDTRYRAHRLAWIFMYGESAPHGIDHRDGVPDHNWISNLRLATVSQNQQNQRRPHRNSSSPYLGVHFFKSRAKWVAYINVDSKRTHLGYFATPEEARAAYLVAKVRLHPFQTLVP